MWIGSPDASYSLFVTTAELQKLFMENASDV
jgi:hypothetical protein